MKKRLFYVGLMLVPLFASCNTSKPKSEKFTGITQMDNFGTVQGIQDTTDWRCNDSFTDKENALFPESSAEPCKLVSYKTIFYPNPCRKKSTLYFVKDPSVRVAFRLVDKDFNVIMSKDSIYNSPLEFDLSSFKTDDTIRLYYKFITKDKCEYNGHGDIFVNPYK